MSKVTKLWAVQGIRIEFVCSGCQAGTLDWSLITQKASFQKGNGFAIFCLTFCLWNNRWGRDIKHWYPVFFRFEKFLVNTEETFLFSQQTRFACATFRSISGCFFVKFLKFVASFQFHLSECLLHRSSTSKKSLHKTSSVRNHFDPSLCGSASTIKSWSRKQIWKVYHFAWELNGVRFQPTYQRHNFRLRLIWHYWVEAMFMPRLKRLFRVGDALQVQRNWSWCPNNNFGNLLSGE